MVKQVGGREPAMAGPRRGRGGGHRLGVRGAVVSSGEGHGGGGGARRWSEVALDGKAASANEGGGWLSASMGPCGGQWLSGRLGVAQRCMRALRSGQRLVHGAKKDGEKQSGAGECSVAIAVKRRRQVRLLLGRLDALHMGRRLHALRMEARRKEARVIAAAGAVRMQR
jgi:hypothetical protein